MSRRLTVSAVFGFVLVLVASAQPESDPLTAAKRAAEKKAAEAKSAENKAAEKKAGDLLDGMIGAALANDADVKLAHAKLQLADAELARARQLVTQKVVVLDSAIREQKKAVTTAEEIFKIANDHYKSGTGSFHDLLAAREKLEAAQSKLAQLETELKLMTGSAAPRAVAADGWSDLNAVHRNLTWGASCLTCHTPAAGLRPQPDDHVRLALSRILRVEPIKGPIADRIRIALDKVVKVGPKDAKVTIEQALDLFKKEAGLDVPVRAEFKVGPIVSLGEELPVGAWLQLFADGTPNVRIVVREYGLLVTSKDVAPPDAISVFDFWKQKPEKKEPEGKR